MKTKVLWTWTRHFAHYVWGLVASGVIYLPLIVFLASLTLVLDDHQVFRAADDGVIGAVAALRGPADPEDPDPSFASAIISRDLFAKELGRTLPFGKEKLERTLQLLNKEGPKLIAVDVDAIPRSVPSTAAATDQPMFQAIRSLLDNGTSVVLVSYPSRTFDEELAAFAWRRSFCAAASHGEPGKGKLWWASSYLDVEGRGTSVIRFHGRDQAEALEAADGALLPLGLVLAAIVDPRKKLASLREKADYCAKALGTPPAGTNALTRKAPAPDSFVNYFSKMPEQLWISCATTLPKGAESLKGKAVVLGVQSFEGVDEHATPLGKLPGATVHTLIAASVSGAGEAGHGLKFMFDVAVGFLFVPLFHLLQGIRDAVSRNWPRADSVVRVLSVLLPLLALAIASSLLLAFAPKIAAGGVWINPLPMLIGLLAHLYVELIPDSETHQTHSPAAALHRWMHRLATAANRLASFNRLSWELRTDAVVWTAVQFLMWTTVALALFIIFYSEH